MRTTKETITAIATPKGIGALAIIRISGDESHDIFLKTVKEKKRFVKLKEKEISIFTIVNDEEIIDQITAIKYKSPKSYTGEDMVEIICHGGIVTVNEVIKILIQSGARIAHRGEFTKRAFNNGKIDLLKVEGIKGIIESTSLIENRNALNVYFGKALKKTEIIQERIIHVLSDVESEIEFNENDDVVEKESVKGEILKIKLILEDEITKRSKIKELEDGIKILIAGPPNAGKSTLYNKILGFNRSIINETPGTTRDLITEKIEISKKTLTLIDSAGIRITGDLIEKEGINKAIDEIEESTIIIWITSADEKITKEEIDVIRNIKNRRTIYVINKTDKESSIKEDEYKKEGLAFLKTSLINEEPSNVEKQIEIHLEEINSEINLNECVINDRQEEIIKNLYNIIKSAIERWNEKEIVSIYLNEALKEIEQYTGKISNQEIMNTIFEKFCIGK